MTTCVEYWRSESQMPRHRCCTCTASLLDKKKHGLLMYLKVHTLFYTKWTFFKWKIFLAKIEQLFLEPANRPPPMVIFTIWQTGCSFFADPHHVDSEIRILLVTLTRMRIRIRILPFTLMRIRYRILASKERLKPWKSAHIDSYSIHFGLSFANCCRSGSGSSSPLSCGSGSSYYFDADPDPTF